ncbi:MAG: alpha-glucan family phosphorylase [Candidatus Omnitrophica bacterium]|nr:alpha-glucan family phosphorylase [Candidatus Omnitrophota bacterium]
MAEKPAHYFGIESRPLYEKGIDLFLESLAKEPELVEKLDFLQKEIDRQKKEFYPAPLWKFDRKWKALEKNKIEFAEFLSFLKRFGGINLEKWETMQHDVLWKKITAYHEQIKNHFLNTKTLKALAKKDEILNLTGKLMRLELTREEWEKLELAGDKLPFDSNKLKTQQNFYRNAMAREKVMLENWARKIPDTSQTSMIVAGGFHMEGFRQTFEKNKTSYILISPAIEDLPRDIRYREFMRGEVSWKNYFKIKNGRVDLYEAFTRATRDRLLAEGRQWLKPWRDNIIRILAAEKRLGEAKQYTRLIDEILAPQIDSTQIKTLKTQWLNEVDRFFDGLKNLQDKNQLSTPNIMRLAHQPTAEFPYAVPAGTVPARWLAAKTMAASEMRIAAAPGAALNPAVAVELTPLQQLAASAGGGLRIGFIAAKAGGPDGVSREMENWARVLRRAGHSIHALVADGEMVLEEVEGQEPVISGQLPPVARYDSEDNQKVLAAFPNLPPSTRYSRIEELRASQLSDTALDTLIMGQSEIIRDSIKNWVRLNKIDVLIIENLNVLPEAFLLSVGVKRAIGDLPTPVIFHNYYDPSYLESDDFKDFPPGLQHHLRDKFPPQSTDVFHTVLSEKAQGEFRAAFPGIPAEEISADVIYNVQDFKNPPPPDDYTQSFRADLGFAEDDIIFAFPSRLIFRKGLDFALQLIKNISNPKVKLLLMEEEGDENYRTSIQRYIAELGLVDRVRFMKDRSGVNRLGLKRSPPGAPVKIYTADDVYRVASVVLYPSQEENFGAPILDAIRAGLPVVVYKYQVFKDEIRKEGMTFFYFPTITSNPPEPKRLRRALGGSKNQERFKTLASEIMRLLDDSNRKNQITAKNREIAGQHFSYEYLDERLAVAIDTAIAKRTQSSDHLIQQYDIRSEDANVLLENLEGLNNEIEALSRAGQQQQGGEHVTRVALVRLRRERYAPAIRKALQKLSDNLRQELPSQRALMLAIAERLGERKRFEENDFLIKPIWRYLREHDRWDVIAGDNEIVKLLIAQMKKEEAYRNRRETWVSKNAPELQNNNIVYFSAEYGRKSLKIYSGGLGVLSGDHYSGASDFGLKFTAMGLLYKKGYFKQKLGVDGQQLVDYDYQGIKYEDLPLLEAGANGEEIMIDIPMPEAETNVRAKVWKVLYGETVLYLLDTDIDGNNPHWRKITERLYENENGSHQRMQQYFALGVGGMLALKKLGIAQDSIHLNDGHPFFTAMQAIRFAMDEVPAEHIWDNSEEGQIRFEMALEKVMAKIVFTTHTPIEAGNESVEVNILRPFLEKIFPNNPYAVDRLLALGDYHGKFSLTVFSMRIAQHRNAVSELHGHVARRMWQHLFPGMKLEEVPIDHVVNAVHRESWQAQEIEKVSSAVWQDEGLVRKMQAPPTTWQEDLASDEWADENIPIDSEELWQAHIKRKDELIKEIIRRKEKAGVIKDDLDYFKEFKSEVLTLGYARRFIEYKRALLILRNLDRLEAIAKRTGKPLQIIFAGKAHRADEKGQALIEELHKKAKDLRQRGNFVKIAFIEEYNIELARYLESGVDVWLNSPIRPREASGTSGMKAAMNGVLNLSTKDGWVTEGIIHGVNGWLYGVEGVERNDFADMEALYAQLDEVAGLYYQDGRQQWKRMMKKAIVSSAYYFGMERMLIDYSKKMYQPAAASSKAMTWQKAEERARWRMNNKKNLRRLASGDARPEIESAEVSKNLVLGQEHEISVEVDFHNSSPDTHAADLFFEPEQDAHVEKENRRISQTARLKRTIPLSGSRYRFIFAVTPEFTGRHYLHIRVAPKDQISWENSAELADATKWLHPKEPVYVWQLNILQFRANYVKDQRPVEEGLPFWIQLPPGVQPSEVLWASARTADGQNGSWASRAIPMQLIPGAENLWGVVVSRKEFLDYGPYDFKFIVRFADGRKEEWLPGSYPINSKTHNAHLHIHAEDPSMHRSKVIAILDAMSRDPGVRVPAYVASDAAAPSAESMNPMELGPQAIQVLLNTQDEGPDEYNGFAFSKGEGEGNYAIQKSKSGFLGFLEGYRRLAERPDELNTSLLYHAKNTDGGNRPSGDIPYYLLNVIFKDTYLPSLTGVIAEIREVSEKMARPETTDEQKIAYTKELLDYLVAFAQGLAWQLTIDYAKNVEYEGDGKIKRAVDALQHPSQGRFLRWHLIHFLDNHHAEKLQTTDGEDVYAYAIPYALFGIRAPDGGNALLLINIRKQVSIVEGAEKADSNVRSIGMKKVLGERLWAREGGFLQERSIPKTAKEGKKGGRIGQKEVADFKGTTHRVNIPGKLTSDAPGPINLEILGYDSAEPDLMEAYIQAAIKGRDHPTDWSAAPEELITRQITASLDNGKVAERTKRLLDEIVGLGASAARERFGADNIPVIMALIGAIAPDRLNSMQDWHRTTYDHWKTFYARGNNREIFEQGTLTIIPTRTTRAFIIKRSLNGRNRFILIHLARIEQFDSSDEKTSITTTEIGALDLGSDRNKKHQVQNEFTGRLYAHEHTHESLTRTVDEGGGWHLRVGKDRYQGLSWEDAEVKAEGARHKLGDLTVEVNIEDLGTKQVQSESEDQPDTFSSHDSFEHFLEILPDLANAGIGKMYLTWLYQMSESSTRIHTGRDGDLNFITVDRRRVTVKGWNYPGKRLETTLPNGRRAILQDDAGNPFSIMIDPETGLPRLNPHIFKPGQEGVDQLKMLIERLHAIGIKAILDFIPWLAPDAINEKNYKWTLYKELDEPADKEEWATAVEDSTEDMFIVNRLARNSGYFAVRITEEGKERVILVKHFRGENIDQAILNPFHEEVRDYYFKYLKFLVDLGVDEVRVDLAAELLNAKVRGAVEDPSLAINKKPEHEAHRFRENDELWSHLIKRVKDYAGEKQQDFKFIMEAYKDEYGSNWPREKLEELGADSLYYKEVFDEYFNLERRSSGASPAKLSDQLKYAFDVRYSKRFIIFGSNFDEMSMDDIGGAKEAMLMKLFFYANAGVPTMIALRDLMDVGLFRTLPGGEINPSTHLPDLYKPSAHSWEADPARMWDRSIWEEDNDPNFPRRGLRKIIRESRWLALLHQFTHSLAEKGEDFIIHQLGTSDGNVMSAMAQREPEQPKRWKIIVSRHNLNDQDTFPVSVDLPHELRTDDGNHVEAIDDMTGQKLKIEHGKIWLNLGPGPHKAGRFISIRPMTLAGSEMRVIDHSSRLVLRALATRKLSRSEARMVAALGEQNRLDALETAARKKAASPHIFRQFLRRRNILGFDSPEIQQAFEVEGFLSRPDYEGQMDQAMQMLKNKMIRRAIKSLNKNPKGRLNYAAVFSLLEADGKTLDWLWNYVEIIQAVKKMAKSKFPHAKVEGNIQFLMQSSQMQSEAFKRFASRVDRSNEAKRINLDDDDAMARLEKYLRDNKSALIYGFDRLADKLADSKYRIRIVKSQIPMFLALPAEGLMTSHLAADEQGVNAESIFKVLEVLPDMMVWNRNFFEITTEALQLIDLIQRKISTYA